ncbi:diguanylate cyclase [Aquipuribacter nitratireducens]|uniref:Diguanylate cyclase n=1 Tax=Aquipuribacter nitratireducens TaxID=650104 RepID=A0ABW0GSD0_9MICO
MSIRWRLFAALVAAAVVPLLGVFTIVGVLLPWQVGEAEQARLRQIAAAASSLLVAECAAVADRAALVTAQLQAQVSATAAEVSPERAFSQAAAGVSGTAVTNGDPWTVVVLDRDGVVVGSAGEAVPAAVETPEVVARADCSSGSVLTADGDVVLADTVDVTFIGPGGQVVEQGSVLVAAPLDDELLGRVTEAAGLRTGSILLLNGDDVVAASGSLSADDEIAGNLAAAAVADADGVGRVVDQRFVSRQVFGDDVRVVAVGEPRGLVGQQLVIAFVASVFGTALLIWLLSATILRPLRDVADLARRIAAGDDTAEVPTAPDDRDLRGVSSVLGSLARDLRAREEGVQRQQEVFAHALQQTHDRDGLLQSVLQGALLAAEAPMGVAVHHDRGSRLGRRVLSLRERGRGDESGPLEEPLRTGLTRLADRALAEQALLQEPGGDTVGPTLAVPIGSSARPLGAVVVARPVGAPGYDSHALEAIAALAGNAGTALANIKDHLEVERLSVTDPLTGVHNFRHLSTMLVRELERAVRFGHPLGVLMVDLDRFKAVNDTHGHAAGDAVLRELARRVTECVREVDTVARYGGEEFALLLPETDLDGATALAERILAALRVEPFRLPDGAPPIPVSASIGIAAYPQHGTTGTDLMRAADRALYEAKEAGRDRARVARLPGGEPSPVVPAGARD